MTEQKMSFLRSFYDAVCEKENIDLKDYILEGYEFDDYKSIECKMSLETAGELGYKLFQIYDCKSLFRTVLTVMLNLRLYNQIATMVSKALVNAHFSEPPYNSTQYVYSAEERYFDRFLEMLRTADIDLHDHFAILLAPLAASSVPELKIWIRPSMELIYKIAGKDFAYLIKKIEETEYSFEGYKALIHYDADYVLDKLIDNLLHVRGVNRTEYRAFLTMHKAKVVTKISKFLDDDNIFVKEGAIRMLLCFKHDSDIHEILYQIFLSEKSKTLRSLIGRECGFTEQPIDFSELELLRKYSESEHGSRSSFKGYPEICYNDNTPIESKTLKFIIKFLSAADKSPVQKFSLKGIKNYITSDSLQDFAAFAAKSADPVKDKWLSYFISLFGSDSTVNELWTRVKTDKKAKNLFVRTLFLSDTRTAQVLLLDSCKHKALRTSAMAGLESAAKLNGVEIDDIVDRYIPDYLKNLEFTDNVNNVKFYGDVSNLAFIVKDRKGRLTDIENLPLKVKKEALRIKKKIDREIVAQAERFYDAFMLGREYSAAQFEKNILGNKLMSRIAETLVFAEYREEAASQIFTVLNQQPVTAGFIKNPIELRGLKIKLLHPVESENWQNISKAFPIQPFKQLQRMPFEITEQEVYANAIVRFRGSSQDKEAFLSNAKKYGWKYSERADKRECIYRITQGKLIELLFSTNVYTRPVITLAEAKFYDSSLIAKSLGQYVLSGTNNIHITEIDKRLLSETIYDIYRMIKE